MSSIRAEPNRVSAWRPDVAGIEEVFHADFGDHAYPMHTHASWALLMIDSGAVRYALDRREHGALTSLVTLLPPHVPHDGSAARPTGFRKRVLYLSEDALGPELIGPAVDRPELIDPLLLDRVQRLHAVLERLRSPTLAPSVRTDEAPRSVEAWEADSRLALVRGRLAEHLSRSDTPPVPRDPGLAARLRDLLDADVSSGLTLAEAGRRLGADPTHLIRTFGAAYGLPPHRYLTGRRVDRARGLLLAGMPAAEVATQVGFVDQSHLTRHLRRMIGTTPSRYVAGPARRRLRSRAPR